MVIFNYEYYISEIIIFLLYIYILFIISNINKNNCQIKMPPAKVQKENRVKVRLYYVPVIAYQNYVLVGQDSLMENSLPQNR